MSKCLGPVRVRRSEYQLLLPIRHIILSYLDSAFSTNWTGVNANYIQTGFVEEQIELRKDWLMFGVCG